MQHQTKWTIPNLDEVLEYASFILIVIAVAYFWA